MSGPVSGCSFRVFASALADGGVVKCIRVPDGARISNSRLKPPKGDVVSEAIAAGEGGCSARQDLDLQLLGRHMTQKCKHVDACLVQAAAFT